MSPALRSSKRLSIAVAGSILVVLGLAPSAQGACKTVGNVVVYDQNADTWDPDNLWDPNTAQSATNKPSFAGNVSRAVKGDSTGCVNYWLSIHALSGSDPPVPAFPPFAKFNSNMKALAEFSWAKTFKKYSPLQPTGPQALGDGIAWRTAMTASWPTTSLSWSMNEAPQAIRPAGPDRAAIRTALLQVSKGLYLGQGGAVGGTTNVTRDSKGAAFYLGVSNTTASLGKYRTSLFSWFADSAQGWAELANYVQFNVNETYGSCRSQLCNGTVTSRDARIALARNYYYSWLNAARTTPGSASQSQRSTAKKAFANFQHSYAPMVQTVWPDVIASKGFGGLPLQLQQGQTISVARDAVITWGELQIAAASRTPQGERRGFAGKSSTTSGAIGWAARTPQDVQDNAYFDVRFTPQSQRDEWRSYLSPLNSSIVGAFARNFQKNSVDSVCAGGCQPQIGLVTLGFADGATPTELRLGQSWWKTECPTSDAVLTAAVCDLPLPSYVTQPLVLNDGLTPEIPPSSDATFAGTRIGPSKTVPLAAADASLIECSLDGAPFTTCWQPGDAATVALSNLTEDEHTFQTKTTSTDTDVTYSDATRWYSTNPTLTGVLALDGHGKATGVGANQTGSYSMQGNAGDLVFIRMTEGTFPNGAVVSILAPDGSTVAAQSGNPRVYLSRALLPVTGTYQVTVIGQGGAAGQGLLEAFKIVDQTGALSLSGVPSDVVLTTPGQHAKFTFSGVVGQKVFLRLANRVRESDSFTVGTEFWTFDLIRPDGATQTFCLPNGQQACYNGQITLEQTGTYTVEARNSDDITMTGTLQAWGPLANTSTTITRGGASKTFNIDTPGDTNRFTFATTTANDKVFVRLTATLRDSDTYDPGITDIHFLDLFAPDGTRVQHTGCNIDHCYLEDRNLVAVGTYTVVIDPDNDMTATGTIQAWKPADQTGAITVGGAAKAVNLTTPGSQARYTFSRNAGQVVTASIVNVANSSPSDTNYLIYRVSLFNASGTEVAYQQCVNAFNPTCTIQSFTIPTTGTYTVVVDPPIDSTLTGSLTVVAG